MRLVTRCDFDGLACGILLVEKGIVHDFQFAHPKDVQDGKIEVSSSDVLANVPYVPGCGLWFDHHMSEVARLDVATLDFEGECRPAPSAAQVIWDYYGGLETFDSHFELLLDAVNKADSADLAVPEILQPEEWVLLAFLMDPRTGLEHFTDYEFNIEQLMITIMLHCRRMTADEILSLPDVAARARRYWEHQAPYMDMLKWSAKPEGNVIVTYIMTEETLVCGNRFLVFAMFPDQNVEVRVLWGVDRKKVIFAVGHSITNRTCTTDIGKLMLEYGGGGHTQVGSCRVDAEGWQDSLTEIVNRLQENV